MNPYEKLSWPAGQKKIEVGTKLFRLLRSTNVRASRILIQRPRSKICLRFRITSIECLKIRTKLLT